MRSFFELIENEYRTTVIMKLDFFLIASNIKCFVWAEMYFEMLQLLKLALQNWLHSEVEIANVSNLMVRQTAEQFY